MDGSPLTCLVGNSLESQGWAAGDNRASGLHEWAVQIVYLSSAQIHRPHIFVPLVGAVVAFAALNTALEDRTENEKAAIAALKTIQTAQTQYYSQFGRYASSLRQLGGRDGSGKSTPEAAGLLDSELASGVRKGYRFALEGQGTTAFDY